MIDYGLLTGLLIIFLIGVLSYFIDCDRNKKSEEKKEVVTHKKKRKTSSKKKQ